ncbi:hypothetical protein ABZV93_20955 [Actinopolymorpha sp. NPDC004070]|uniref:hypothetical protein n=1 Tax=Actinopolymorpha sp. NPDC004070 TaxID=3154548 RepID=UPI0033B63418
MPEPHGFEFAAAQGSPGPSCTAPDPDVGRGQVRDPLVFCVSGGTGGFGGAYWVDDRMDESGREYGPEEVTP